MSGYRDILLSHLSRAGWEQVEVIATSEWRAAEFWRIRSIKHNWGFELILTFVVDPQAMLPAESPRRASAVWEVVATPDFPAGWNDGSAIATMPTRERHIHEHIEKFLSLLDDARKA